MAFTLPTDLSTGWVDGSSTIAAADWNTIDGMANAIKAAIGTFGFNTKTATVATSETTTATTYSDLTTTTDQVTVAVGSSGMALVTISAYIAGSGYAGLVGYAMSGANTSAANDTKSIKWWSYNGQNGDVSATFLETGLAPGFTTFKLKYVVTNASYTYTFSNRRISVIPFPSNDGTHEAGAFNLDASSPVALGMSGYGNPVRYSSTGAGTVATGARSNMTWSHTASSGDTVLVWVETNSGEYVTAGTYGGVAMSILYTASTPDTNYTLTLLSADNVAAGASTVSVTKNSAAHSMQGNSVGYANVQSMRGLTTASGVGMTASIDVAPALGEVAVGGTVTYYGSPYDSTSGGTNRWNNGGAAAQAISDSLSPATLSATQPGATRNWAAIGVLLSPAARTGSLFNLGVTPAISMTAAKPPTFDAVGSGAGTHSGTVYNFPITIDADANVLIAAFSGFVYLGYAYTTIKVGATEGTAVTVPEVDAYTAFSPDGYYNWTARYHVLLNPPKGSLNVYVNGNNGICNAMTFKNVGRVGTLAKAGQAIGAGQPSHTVAGVPADQRIAHIFMGSDTGALTAYNQTERANANYASGPMIMGEAAGGASVTFTATAAAGVRGWASLGVPLIPPSAYATMNLGVTPTLSMTAAKYNATVDLPFAPTIGVTAVGHSMPPAIQGTPNVAHAASVTIPTHAVGDIIVIFAHRGTTGSPSKPSAAGTVPAWTDIDTQSGSYSNCRTAYFVATATDHTSGTWTNADSMIAVVLRGVAASPIGGHAVSVEGATGNTCPGAAVTMSKTDGSSTLLAFYGFGDGANTVTSIAGAPSGWTRQVTGTYAGTPGTALCLNTKNDTTSDGAVAQTSTTTTWTRSATVEILSP